MLRPAICCGALRWRGTGSSLFGIMSLCIWGPTLTTKWWLSLLCAVGSFFGVASIAAPLTILAREAGMLISVRTVRMKRLCGVLIIVSAICGCAVMTKGPDVFSYAGKSFSNLGETKSLIYLFDSYRSAVHGPSPKTKTL